MDVYVVLKEDSKDKSISVLGVYTDEGKANRRVKWERGFIDENVWYQDSKLDGEMMQ